MLNDAQFIVGFEEERDDFEVDFGEVANVGVKRYADLPDKPAINGVKLEGDKSFEDLGAEVLTNSEIEQLLNNN